MLRFFGLFIVVLLWMVSMVSCGEKKCSQGDCLPGQVCLQGTCTFCSVAKPLNCNGVCVSVVDDDEHCGDCGKKCPEGRTCVGGSCLCQDPTLECDGKCVDISGHRDHCAACSRKCDTSERCIYSKCTGKTCEEVQLTTCGRSCVDTRLNPLHCGACDKRCKKDEVCLKGSCKCGPKDTRCDGKCVDTSVNWEHCGGCGKKCDPGRLCAAGKCVATCPRGTPSACFGGCYDLKNDARHCGSCGGACHWLQKCIDGSCKGKGEHTDEQTGEGVSEVPTRESSPAHEQNLPDGGANEQNLTEGSPSESTLPETSPKDTVNPDGKTCTSGETYCSGVKQCIPLHADDKHCGACTKPCSSDRVCQDKMCVQPFVRAFSGIMADSKVELFSDDNGKFFLTGNFNAKLSFGGKQETPNGLEDGVVVIFQPQDRSTPSKTIFSMHPFGSADPDVLLDAHFDKKHGVYIAGDLGVSGFLKGSSFKAGSAESEKFIARLSTKGTWDRYRNLEPSGNTGGLIPWGVFVNRAGEVIVLGGYSGEAKLDGIKLPSPKNGMGGFLAILKDNPSAKSFTVTELHAFESGLLDSAEFAEDSKGNIFIAASLSSNATFGKHKIVFPQGKSIIAAVKWDRSSKSWAWAVPFTVGATPPHVKSLFVDSADNVYMSGDYNIEMEYKAGSNSKYVKTSEFSAFALSLNNKGELRWLKSFTKNKVSRLGTLIFDNFDSKNERLYVCGVFIDEIELAGKTFRKSPKSAGLFLTELDMSTGKPKWGQVTKANWPLLQPSMRNPMRLLGGMMTKSREFFLVGSTEEKLTFEKNNVINKPSGANMFGHVFITNIVR